MKVSIPALPNQTQDFMAQLCFMCKSVLLLQSVSPVSKLHETLVTDLNMYETCNDKLQLIYPFFGKAS